MEGANLEEDILPEKDFKAIADFDDMLYDTLAYELSFDYSKSAKDVNADFVDRFKETDPLAQLIKLWREIDQRSNMMKVHPTFFTGKIEIILWNHLYQEVVDLFDKKFSGSVFETK